MRTSYALPGVEGQVQIFRDPYGIPHVRARSPGDAFFAQGFAQAQDRLWQLEWDRRRACGTSAELVGDAAVPHDVLFRRLRLIESARRDLRALDGSTRLVLGRYCDGINAWIERAGGQPREFRLLGTLPAPWLPEHCLAVYKFRHVLNGTGFRKLWRGRILRTLGPAAASRLVYDGSPQPSTPLVSPEALAPGSPGPSTLDELTPRAATQDDFGGSNHWVVAGSRTRSGLPLMAGDPHRNLEVPNVYYQNHLACDDFDVVGLSFVGVPGFPHFGHNADLAWSITHGFGDNQDVYAERFAKPEVNRSPIDQHIPSLESEILRLNERIRVRSSTDVTVDIVETPRGSVIAVEAGAGVALALRYTATAMPDTSFDALLPMMTASSVAGFRETMRCWVEPVNNVLVADRQGEIAYFVRGRVALRHTANRWLPVPGWDSSYEWQDHVPFDDLPVKANPPEGFLVTANSRIETSGDRPYIALEFLPAHRRRRIESHLEKLPAAAAADMSVIHGDVVSLPAETFVRALERLRPSGPLAGEALAVLRRWDRRMDRDSAGAAVYAELRSAMVELIVGQRWVGDLDAGSGATTAGEQVLGTVIWWLLPQIVADADRTFLDDELTWADFLSQSFTLAVDRCRRGQAPNPSEWNWGRVHRTHPRHPLSEVFPEHRLELDLPGVEIGGDGDTVAAAGGPDGVSHVVASTSVARYVFDVGDWSESRWIVPFGAAGDASAEHATDQLEKWAANELVPMYYEWDRIAVASSSIDELTPGP